MMKNHPPETPSATEPRAEEITRMTPAQKQDITIQVIDDEENICEYCSEFLTSAGYRVVADLASGPALDRLRSEPIAVMLVDLKLPDQDGIALIREAKRINPNLEAILMTAYTSIESAVAALKSGAFDYLPKPFDKEQLLLSIERAVEKYFLNYENVQLKELMSIAEVTQAMSSTMDVNVLLEFILETIIDMLKAENGSIMLFDPAAKTLAIACQVGLPDEVAAQSVQKLGERIAGWVAQTREPVILQNGLRTDPRFQHLTPRTDIRSALSVPLVFWEQLVGVLNVSRTELPVPFTRTDLELATIIGTHIAIALEHSRMCERLRQQAKR